MRIVRKTVAVFLSLWLVVPSVGAGQSSGQSHVADRGALDQAVAKAAARAEADRATIRRVLARPEVKDVVAKTGIEMTRVESAVGLLKGAELRQAADYATQIEQDLAGGATTVVITATTIIIILLIIIIIVLIAD